MTMDSKATEQDSAHGPLDEEWPLGFTLGLVAAYAVVLVVAPLVLYVTYDWVAAAILASAVWFVLMGHLSGMGAHMVYEFNRHTGWL